MIGDDCPSFTSEMIVCEHLATHRFDKRSVQCRSPMCASNCPAALRLSVDACVTSDLVSNSMHFYSVTCDIGRYSGSDGLAACPACEYSM